MFFDLRPSPFDEQSLARAKAYLNSKSSEEVEALAIAAAQLDVAHRGYLEGATSKAEVRKRLVQCLALLKGFEERTFENLVREAEEDRFQWEFSSFGKETDSDPNLDPVFSLYETPEESNSEPKGQWRWSEKLLYLFPCHVEAEAVRLAGHDHEVEDEFELPEGLPVVRLSSEPEPEAPSETESDLSLSLRVPYTSLRSALSQSETVEPPDEPLRRLLEESPAPPLPQVSEDSLDLELDELLGDTARIPFEKPSQPLGRMGKEAKGDPLSRLLEDSPEESPPFSPAPEVALDLERPQARDPLEHLLGSIPEPLAQEASPPGSPEKSSGILPETDTEQKFASESSEGLEADYPMAGYPEEPGPAPASLRSLDPLENLLLESPEEFLGAALQEQPLPDSPEETPQVLPESLDPPAPAEGEPDTTEPSLAAPYEEPVLAEASDAWLETSPKATPEEVLGVPLGAPLGEPLTVPSERRHEDVEDDELSEELGLGGIEFHQAIPVFRIFEQNKAREFYCDFLGFQVEWEHQSDERSPVYIAIHREGLTIHLTEHHGDCCPGSSVFVWMSELEQFYEELLNKEYPHFEATMEATPYAWFFETIDPFGNRIRFSQPLA